MNAQVWLDCLPAECCARIAQCLSGGKPTLNALYLAEVSSVQNEAVANAISYTLHKWRHICALVDSDNHCVGCGYPFQESDDFLEQSIRHREFRKRTHARWQSVMRVHVREIGSSFPELLDAPRLRKVFVWASDVKVLEKLFSVASEKGVRSSLREMVIRMDSTESVPLIVEVLGKLRLTALRIEDTVTDDLLCFMGEQGDSRKRRKKTLADFCSTLQYLELNCTYLSENILWEVLPNLSYLKSLVLRRVSQQLPPPFVAWMQSLEDVKVRHVREGTVDYMYQVGGPTGRIRCYENMSVEDVAKLSEYPLKSVEVRAFDFIEQELISRAHRFSKLELLCLCWPSRGSSETRECELYKASYYSSPSGTILCLVRKLPLLKKLGLIHLRLDLSELHAILNHMGSRLEVLLTDIRGQDESALDRYAAILVALAEYNQSLQVLDTCTESVPVVPPQLKTRIARKARSIELLTGRLKRKASLLNAKKLDEYNHQLCTVEWQNS